jgi:hypothetical protein
LILVLLLYALGRGNASQKLQKSWVIKALHDYLHQVAKAVSPLPRRRRSTWLTPRAGFEFAGRGRSADEPELYAGKNSDEMVSWGVVLHQIRVEL